MLIGAFDLSGQTRLSLYLPNSPQTAVEEVLGPVTLSEKIESIHAHALDFPIPSMSCRVDDRCLLRGPAVRSLR